MTTSTESLSAHVTIKAPIDKVWDCWNNPADIMRWNNNDDNWHNTHVENNPVAGDRFLFAMAKKDGSEKFDFSGVYDEVVVHRLMSYTLDDGRKTTITFTGSNPVLLTETFDAKKNLPAEMQRRFCQNVLETFKQYIEEAIG